MKRKLIGRFENLTWVPVDSINSAPKLDVISFIGVEISLCHLKLMMA